MLGRGVMGVIHFIRSIHSALSFYRFPCSLSGRLSRRLVKAQGRWLGWGRSGVTGPACASEQRKGNMSAVGESFPSEQPDHLALGAW